MNSLARFKSKSLLMMSVLNGIGGIFCFVAVSVSAAVDFGEELASVVDEAASA